MSTYIAVFKQDGEGCDYTIECGTKVLTMDASSFADAFDQAMTQMGWNEYFTDPECFDGNPWEHQPMKMVKFYEIAREDGGMFKQFQDSVIGKIAAAKDNKQQAEDEAEFQRLARKLGK